MNIYIEFHLRFSGQYSDSETGLFYNYYRYYNPIIGRYIQPDPIGLAGGFDLYAYVGQNPINGIDPLGLVAYSCSGWPGLYTHGWIIVNDTPFGWNPNVDKFFTSTGKIDIETITEHSINNPGFIKNRCTPITVPQQSKFESCLTNQSKEGINNLDSFKKKLGITSYNAFNIGGDNCFNVRDKIINFCKEASK